MRKTRKSTIRWIAILLLMVHLVSLTACGSKPADGNETDAPTESTAPAETESHSHEFTDGLCQCGVTNGFAGLSVWTEGSLTPVTREDTESTMTITSTNAPGDWWKVKVENNFATVAGKTYEATFNFTSNAAGTIKYHVGAAAFLDSQEYNVAAGSNVFKVRFTAGADKYSCLELGGLGAFVLTFTGICKSCLESF